VAGPGNGGFDLSSLDDFALRCVRALCDTETGPDIATFQRLLNERARELAAPLARKLAAPAREARSHELFYWILIRLILPRVGRL
jgi:hypothetical protein